MDVISKIQQLVGCFGTPELLTEDLDEYFTTNHCPNLCAVWFGIFVANPIQACSDKVMPLQLPDIIFRLRCEINNRVSKDECWMEMLLQSSGFWLNGVFFSEAWNYRLIIFTGCGREALSHFMKSIKKLLFISFPWRCIRAVLANNQRTKLSTIKLFPFWYFDIAWWLLEEDTSVKMPYWSESVVSGQ